MDLYKLPASCFYPCCSGGIAPAGEPNAASAYSVLRTRAYSSSLWFAWRTLGSCRADRIGCPTIGTAPTAPLASHADSISSTSFVKHRATAGACLRLPLPAAEKPRAICGSPESPDRFHFRDLSTPEPTAHRCWPVLAHQGYALGPLAGLFCCSLACSQAQHVIQVEETLYGR